MDNSIRGFTSLSINAKTDFELSASINEDLFARMTNLKFICEKFNLCKDFEKTEDAFVLKLTKEEMSMTGKSTYTIRASIDGLEYTQINIPISINVDCNLDCEVNDG